MNVKMLTAARNEAEDLNPLNPGPADADFRPRILQSHEHTPPTDALARLADEVRDADLAAPPVVLPDFYHKHGMEAPSSIAVATRGTIRPTLTSAAVNCGMALITFDRPRPDEAAITGFYRRVRELYPYPSGYRRDLSAAEVRNCAVGGAEFAVDRWNIDPAELARVEEGGRLPLEPYGGVDRAMRELPWMVTQLARLRFGTIGPSTHFVELQEVEEIFDDDVAALLGVQQGQVTLQYHAGGGVLTGTLGAMYGTRLAGNPLVKAVLRAQKPLHHLLSARSLKELRLRWALYFSGGCPPVPLDSPEGDRLMLANALAMNYGFAFRQATYSVLRAAARDFFGADSRLVVDSPHNSIYPEEHEGETVLVHRHNSARAFPASRMAGHPVFGHTGMPLLLPGTNQTSSYLCVAAEGAGYSLHSACHGTGSIIDDFVSRGLSGTDPQGRSTLRYNYAEDQPERVDHLDDRGVDEGLQILVRHGIVRPVARLRPFAVLN